MCKVNERKAVVPKLLTMGQVAKIYSQNNRGGGGHFDPPLNASRVNKSGSVTLYPKHMSKEVTI